MRKVVFDAGGHRFEVSHSAWSGREKVVVDGRTLSEKRSLYYMTAHIFSLKDESGREVPYEVNLILGYSMNIGYIVRRNGIAIASKP